ncbi:MAG: ACP S-malonyltransferase [Clostridiales bacterium]|nr:ACP S-malonyltransferase [Clostridiales bacterium]
MGRIAFVFSGQGAQYPGMGAELAACSPAAKAVFDMADRIRPGTSAQCFEGTKEELAQTRNTQPCVFCVDLAAAFALRERGLRPDAVAGFSLGELAALAYVGVLEPEQAFSLVCDRAAAMHRCIEHSGGGMAAVVGLPAETVEALCARCGAHAVNYNSPAQTVAAGTGESLQQLVAAVKAEGGRALPLAVEGPFHSPLMAPAAAELARCLSTYTLHAPALPVYANATAQSYGSDAAALIIRQVAEPVRWRETLENMARDGIDTFYEVGPGKTLCGLIAKTLPDATRFSVENRASLEEVAPC